MIVFPDYKIPSNLVLILSAVTIIFRQKIPVIIIITIYPYINNPDVQYYVISFSQ